jgi:hypothetical protein
MARGRLAFELCKPLCAVKQCVDVRHIAHMKVLDLGCDHGHLFEGWFASEADYVSQSAEGLLTCPTCRSPNIQKKLSAPRLNLGAQPPKFQSSAHNAVPVGASPIDPEKPASALLPANQQSSTKSGGRGLLDHNSHVTAIKAMWHAMRAMSTNVGADFAEEARRMHYGEAPERMIHGQASVKDAVELVEEGILVVPLPPDNDNGDGPASDTSTTLPPGVQRH